MTFIAHTEYTPRYNQQLANLYRLVRRLTPVPTSELLHHLRSVGAISDYTIDYTIDVTTVRIKLQSWITTDYLQLKLGEKFWKFHTAQRVISLVEPSCVSCSYRRDTIYDFGGCAHPDLIRSLGSLSVSQEVINAESSLYPTRAEFCPLIPGALEDFEWYSRLSERERQKESR